MIVDQNRGEYVFQFVFYIYRVLCHFFLKNHTLLNNNCHFGIQRMSLKICD